MIAVIDIDGVLADASHRERFVRTRPKDWAAFFDAVTDDAVIAEGRELVSNLSRDHEIVLLSGRPERTRPDTEEWLARQGIGYARLVLRPDRDHRPAPLFKSEALTALGGPEVVAVVVDDDETVVEALRVLGYTARRFP